MRHELPCSQRWHPETPNAKSVFAYWNRTNWTRPSKVLEFCGLEIVRYSSIRYCLLTQWCLLLIQHINIFNCKRLYRTVETFFKRPERGKVLTQKMYTNIIKTCIHCLLFHWASVSIMGYYKTNTNQVYENYTDLDLSITVPSSSVLHWRGFSIWALIRQS